MSKKSKEKRDLKKKRRVRAVSSTMHQRRIAAQSEQNSTLWWWVGGIAVIVLALALILWFTVGPGKSSSPTPTPFPTAAPTPIPTATPPPTPSSTMTTSSNTDSEPADKTSSAMPANPLERNGMYSSPPEMQIDTTKTYRATIETNRGTIELELYPQYAPKTVNNFVFLAQEGYYDNLTFHRVISDFMIQGGDPSGLGSGGPGYSFEDEVGSDNLLTHETGVISMANAGPNTNGSQFFITHSPQPHLDGIHTVFGKVSSGQDIVNAIQQGDTIIRIGIGD